MNNLQINNPDSNHLVNLKAPSNSKFHSIISATPHLKIPKNKNKTPIYNVIDPEAYQPKRKTGEIKDSKAEKYK